MSVPATLAGPGSLPCFIGLMSGTSLDGVDGVLASFPSATAGTPDAPASTVWAHAHAPFDPALRSALADLQQPAANELHRAALAANGLADACAAIVERLLDQTGLARDAVRAIGVHGQTVRHRPELGYTLQLNAPARLAEACGIDVIADFRARDVAAGGQGAPLVPAFHAALFSHPGIHRAVLNLGGIANLTDLPGDPCQPVRGWDTGPGNCLLDGWILRHAGTLFDADGAWARGGTVNATLLASLLAEPWLAMPPPKSTGRDLFNLEWLDMSLATTGTRDSDPRDVQATLAEYTAQTVARDVHRFCPGAAEVIVCGGGSRNLDLLDRLRRALAGSANDPVSVTDSRRHGVPADQVEALAFAWLAHRFVAGLPGNLPAVTGARGLRVLGALYPR